MSKELEALEILNKIKRNGGTDFIINWRDIEIIEQTLIPPTADEVCEALTKYFPSKVEYIKQTKTFIIHNHGEVAIYNILGIKILYPLPPDIITMIGRFYEDRHH